jgi:transcriptional regulator with XRE-family HTH domain
MATRAAAAAKASPGAALRNIRQRKGLTLSQVSKGADLPTSTLSKIENGKLSVTYDKLVRITASLGVDMAELFAASDNPTPVGERSGRRSITRAGEGGVIDTANYNHFYLASDLLHKRFVPIITQIKARTLEEFGPMITHTGDEFTHVLEGELELHTELYAPTRLKKGDSIYFDSATPHAYLAAGSEPCWVLSVCSGPESEIRSMFPPDETKAGQAKRSAPRRKRPAIG